MHVGKWVLLLLVATVGVAHADTESDVWKVKVNLWIPGVGNPLEQVTYKTFGQAEAAMRAATPDGPFLKRYSQTGNTAYYNIPAEDVDFWTPWWYDAHTYSEAEMIAPWSVGGPCGQNTFVPTNAWTLFENFSTYQLVEPLAQACVHAVYETRLIGTSLWVRRRTPTTAPATG